MFNPQWQPPIPPYGGPNEPDDFEGELVDISGPVWPTPLCIIPDGYWPAAAVDLIRDLLPDLLAADAFSPEATVWAATLSDILNSQGDQGGDVVGLPW